MVLVSLEDREELCGRKRQENPHLRTVVPFARIDGRSGYRYRGVMDLGRKYELRSSPFPVLLTRSYGLAQLR